MAIFIASSIVQLSNYGWILMFWMDFTHIFWCDLCVLCSHSLDFSGLCVWRSNLGLVTLSANRKSFEAPESSFSTGGDEGKTGSLAHWVWVWGVGTPFTNCSTFLPGCRERAVFRYTWNRQRALGISPVLVDIQYPGSTAFRWKILQVPGFGRRTCSGRYRTEQDSMLGTPWQISMGKLKCQLW